MAAKNKSKNLNIPRPNYDDTVDVADIQELIDVVDTECYKLKLLNIKSNEIDDAENLRKTEEQKRISNEAARTQAENTRAENENLRINSEKTRHESEQNRVQLFEKITISENSRQGAEQKREKNEKARATAEDSRVRAENKRVNAESAREDAESNRKNAELEREKKDNIIDSMLAETKQVNAETKNFKSAIENNVTKITDSESARITAENGRVNAEETRKQAESGRVDAEKHRTQSEESRTQAESGRVDAEKERVLAESKRDGLYKQVAISENDRTTQEDTRKQAESVRETAEKERAKAESYRTNAEIARANSEKERTTAESLRVSEHATSHQTAAEDHAKITSVLDVIKKLETGEIVAKVAELENKGATKEYVRAQISALIDGAPQDLDTLKELADALKARGGTEEILAKLGEKIGKVQLDEELTQLNNRLTNLIGSKAAQSDLISGLAGKVNNADFDTYKSEATKAIADKVSASNFSTYKDEVAKAMTGKVPTTDFDTYKEEASKLIASKAGAQELENLKSQVGDDLQTKLDGKVDKSKIKDYTIEAGGLPKFIDSHSEVVATAAKDNVFSANTVMSAIRELSKIRSAAIPSGTSEGSVVGNSTGVPIKTLPELPDHFDPTSSTGRGDMLATWISVGLGLTSGGDVIGFNGKDNPLSYELEQLSEKGGKPETALSSRSVYLLIGLLYNWLTFTNGNLATTYRNLNTSLAEALNKLRMRDRNYILHWPEIRNFDDIRDWLYSVEKGLHGDPTHIVDMDTLEMLVSVMGRYIMGTIYSETQPLLLRSSFQACRDLIAGVLFPTPGAYISENVLSLADTFFTDKAAATDYWQMLVNLAFSTSSEKHDDLYNNTKIEQRSFEEVMKSWADANYRIQQIKLKNKEYSTNKSFISATQKSKFVETVLTTREFTAILSKSNTAICNLWIGICKYLKRVQKKMIPDILAKENEWPSLYQKHKNLLLKRFSDIDVFYTLNVMLKGPADSRLGHLWETYAGKHSIESAAFPEYVQWLYKLIPEDIKHKKET